MGREGGLGAGQVSVQMGVSQGGGSTDGSVQTCHQA